MPDDRSARDDLDEDALDLLATDHDEIAEAFDRYDRLASEGAAADERRDAAEEICTLLLVHAATKEEIFYPAVRAALDDDTLVDEGLVGLDGARSLVDEIQSADAAEPRYDTQVRVLHELLTEHFDEERRVLFPRVRLASLDLQALGADMAARQEQLLSAEEDTGAA